MKRLPWVFCASLLVGIVKGVGCSLLLSSSWHCAHPQGQEIPDEACNFFRSMQIQYQVHGEIDEQQELACFLFFHIIVFFLQTMISSATNFQIEGTLVAPPKRSYWIEATIRHWILFKTVRGLTVTGGGTIDGNGKIWWQSSCKVNPKLVSILYF